MHPPIADKYFVRPLNYQKTDSSGEWKRVSSVLDLLMPEVE